MHVDRDVRPMHEYAKDERRLKVDERSERGTGHGTSRSAKASETAVTARTEGARLGTSRHERARAGEHAHWRAERATQVYIPSTHLGTQVHAVCVRTCRYESVPVVLNPRNL